MHKPALVPLFSKISPIDILIWSTFTESELTAKWLFQFDVALLSLKLSHKALYMKCDSLDACLPILTLIQIKLFLLFSHCFAKRCQKILKKYFRSKIIIFSYSGQNMSLLRGSEMQPKLNKGDGHKSSFLDVALKLFFSIFSPFRVVIVGPRNL